MINANTILLSVLKTPKQCALINKDLGVKELVFAVRIFF